MPPPRPHPLAVSRAARLAERAIAAVWRCGIDAKPPLDPQALWRIGSDGYTRDDEAGGRCAEDVDDFRERLDRLCTSLREEARLGALGHTLAYGQLTAAIRKRHALGRLWRRKPELARTAIATPIIVFGQMRSGTTRVHRLLAADPALAATRFCDSFDPLPASPDWRPLKAMAALALARTINPWLDTLHPFGATRPDEEIGWLSAALSPCAFEAQWHIPTFVAWSEARDPAPVYREFDRILRTDAAIRRNADRPRVLKCPQFAEDAAALSAHYPAAMCVVARRDAGDVLASSVSLVASQSAFQSQSRSVDAIAGEWRRKLALRQSRMEAGLAKHPGPVATVEFDELESDWRAAMERIYAALRLNLSAHAQSAMERLMHREAHSPHRAHAPMRARFVGGKG